MDTVGHDEGVETTADAACPNCDATGALGQPCGERGCQRRGYRFIPAAWHAGLVDAPAGTVDPLIGVAIGDYLVVDKLGEGGFGKVFLALQQPIQLKAALKLMTQRAGDPELAALMVEKFQGEAQALASLTHPNIVRLLKYGSHGDTPYLVMEFVEGGRTLKSEIAEAVFAGQRLSPEVSLHIVRQVANALEAAHERSIVHRDIKPENVMLQRVSGDAWFARVLDFGLAKFVDERTRTSTTMGTPVYMAPEQLTKGSIGPWTDLYALGIVTFELLTGRSPFAGRTHQAILTSKVDPAYDPVSRLADVDLPPALAAFFARALERDPERRFRDAAAFRAGLEEVGAALAAAPAVALPVGDMSELLDSADLERLELERSRRDVVTGDADTQAAAPAPTYSQPAPPRPTVPGGASMPAPTQTHRAVLSDEPAPPGRSPWPFVGVGALVAAGVAAALFAASGGDGPTPEPVRASAAAEPSPGATPGATDAGPSPVARADVVVATLAPDAGPPGPDPDDVALRALLIEADSHLAAERWDDAIAAFSKALALDPEHAEAKAGLARASRDKSVGQRYEAARLRLAEGDHGGAADALAALGEVPADSAYSARVAALRATAEMMAKVASQRAAAAEGDGQVADGGFAKDDADGGSDPAGAKAPSRRSKPDKAPRKPSARERADKLLDAARAALARSQLAVARRALQQAERLDPANPHLGTVRRLLAQQGQGQGKGGDGVKALPGRRCPVGMRWCGGKCQHMRKCAELRGQKPGR